MSRLADFSPLQVPSRAERLAQQRAEEPPATPTPPRAPTTEPVNPQNETANPHKEPL